MRAPSAHPQKVASGFTLLELVLALLLIALLIGMVFTTARSSLVLGNNIVTTQNEEMLHQAFFTFLGDRFSSLPGNANLYLEASKLGARKTSHLTLENIPVDFTWGNEKTTAKAIQISTVKNRSGLLDIVLKYYENEVINPNSSNVGGSGFVSSGSQEKPFAEMILLKDLRFFEWFVLNDQTMEFQDEWTIPKKMPRQLKLVCAFGRDGQPITQVFGIPQRVNPELYILQLQQKIAAGAANNNPTTSTGTNIEINPITQPNIEN